MNDTELLNLLMGELKKIEQLMADVRQQIIDEIAKRAPKNTSGYSPIDDGRD